jgi:hypothetical protein
MLKRTLLGVALILVGHLGVLLIGASQSAQQNATGQATRTRWYLAFGDNFPLLAKPTKVDSPSYWCLSPFQWEAPLGAALRGNRYTINLGLANQTGTSLEGKLRAEILIKSGAKERVIASTTFDTSTKYLARKVTVTGNDAAGQPGDSLILKVTRLEGTPCVFFSGDTSDHFIELLP